LPWSSASSSADDSFDRGGWGRLLLAGPAGAVGALHLVPTDCAKAVTCSVSSTRPISTAASRCPSELLTWCDSSLGIGSQRDTASVNPAKAEAKVDMIANKKFKTKKRKRQFADQSNSTLAFERVFQQGLVKTKALIL
jgi:hypothetical protein